MFCGVNGLIGVKDNGRLKGNPIHKGDEIGTFISTQLMLHMRPTGSSEFNADHDDV
jgi:hypothetical protein